MILTSSNIVLRPLEIKDVDALYRFRNDSEVTARLVGYSAGMSKPNLEQWVHDHKNNADEAFWAIADSKSDDCIGHVALYNIDHRARSAEFGIALDKSAWGHGIGTVSTTAVIRFGFEQLNLHRIYLTVLASNNAAIRLYEQLQFRVEGVMRDHHFSMGQYTDVILMALLDNEWQRAD